jgi:hypothetical protein
MAHAGIGYHDPGPRPASDKFGPPGTPPRAGHENDLTIETPNCHQYYPIGL